ncbi:MAG TPA: hypothetical protein VKA18_02630, partial [Alphaproteobacteria bacterium]|nr:hypothetical protein [Alphaproteobacteria bacterium]
MFYLPPEEFWYLTATKIAAYFDDNQCGSGTGFFVYDESQYFLVTARHVVDPKYLPPSKKRHANCNKLEIFFQSAVNPGTSSATVAYQGLRVDDPSFCFAINEVDVAAIKIPSDFLPVVNKNKVVRPFSFSINYLATNEDFSFRYAGEPLVFIGYPDNS